MSRKRKLLDDIEFISDQALKRQTLYPTLPTTTTISTTSMPGVAPRYGRKRFRKRFSFKGKGRRFISKIARGYTRSFSPYKYNQANYQRKYRAGGELKFYDSVLATTVVTATGIVASPSICLVPMNTTASGRLGRKFTITNIHIQGNIFLPPVAANYSLWSDIIRVIVYNDHQANGAAATVLDVLTTADDKSFRNMFNLDRFTILSDTETVMTVQATNAGTSTGGILKPFRFHKKCKIPIETSDIVATDPSSITGLRSENIGIIALSSVAASTQLDFQIRIRYTDN